MDITTKAVSATITDTSTSADDFPGTFMVELSNESLDRDGDTLKADEWEQPLPDQITFVNDHTHKMASVVGSAKPSLEDGKIICRGDWAETQNGQDTRKVIKHVPYTSVAYREKRDRKSGNVSRELINGSFVVVPSNPKAKVLASKGFDSVDAELDEHEQAFADQVAAIVAKSLGTLGDVINVKMDSPNEHGLTFVVDEKSSTVEVKQHGNVLGTHKFSQQAPEVAPVTTADQSADPLGEKAAAQALAAAFEITSRTDELEG
jgi:hypothetical protein